MAQYLHTQAISAGIVDLIKEARERLVIVSPYLKLSDTLRDHLRDKNADKVMTRVIFGKSDLNPDEMRFLQDLDHIHLYFSKNLHAKCYLNERKMIITSMNLYEFSQVNNREMGVLINRDIDGDGAVYDDAYADIESILRNAENFAYVPAPKKREEKAGKPRVSANAKDKGRKTRASKNPGSQAHCIDCGNEVELDPAHPFCRACYRKWKKSGADSAAKLTVCHICGEDSPVSFEKPACWTCFKANRQLFV